MAIIVDPDNLDRAQVIFGTATSSSVREVSLRAVGTVTTSALSQRTTGYTSASSYIFRDLGAQFTTWGAAAGHILCLFTNKDAGHFVIQSVDSQTQMTINSSYHSLFTGSLTHDIVYDVRYDGSGSIIDGVTEQALYSFSKEEWRTDSAIYGGDDLIRHPFPFEAITREQMELGGGTSHDTWDYNSRDTNYTIKKIRTGGWAKKNAASTTLREYTGIITLGSLDTDAQVYYQQTNTGSVPTNFTFQGTVNEPILIYSSGSADYRSYLKLFVRKKYRTYAGSQISDIGVTTLETIVNRFPLAHATDAAIVETDGGISGSAPFREQRMLAGGTNGAKTISTNIFTSAGATFVTTGTIAGDTLWLRSGTEQGYYTISSVQETAITCSSDADFTTFASSESSLTYEVTTTDLIRTRTNGFLSNSNGTIGVLTSSVGGFASASVGDMVIISEASHANRGVYKIVTIGSPATAVTCSTTDQNFPASANDIDFRVVKKGMYLQQKASDLTVGTTGTIQFIDGSPDKITRTAGSFVSDGFTAGTVITIAGSTNNNGSYTVASVVALTASLVSTDILVNETVTGTPNFRLTATDHFKRSVAGVTYGFKWRLFGNSGSLSECYEFVQHQLRQTTDIDYGPMTSRGDVTDILMAYASPTGTTYNLYIDDLSDADTNNVTLTDATGESRTNNYVAAGTISFNSNLQTDASAEYTMFFTNDDAGDNLGRDFGTSTALIVANAGGTWISGSVGGLPSVSFTYDYDNNIQRGAASAGTDAPVTVVAIGLSTAQYVLLQGTVARSKSNNFSLVSALERNYSNPA